MTRFVHEVHMRWSDMDAYRHINNSAYLAYLEQARVAMFFHRHESFNAGTVISRHEIEYLRHTQPASKFDTANLGRKLEMSALVLWGAASSVGKRFADAARLVVIARQ